MAFQDVFRSLRIPMRYTQESSLSTPSSSARMHERPTTRWYGRELAEREGLPDYTSTWYKGSVGAGYPRSGVATIHARERFALTGHSCARSALKLRLARPEHMNARHDVVRA